MPNQVTEGDRFKAGFSVMNRTDEKRVIDVAVKADGNLETPVAHSETLPLGPYKRKTVYVDVLSSSVERSRLSDKGEIRFSVRAHDRVDGDGLRHHLPVLKRRSLEMAANYGSTVMDEVREDVEIPEGIHTDIGEISMELAPSVIGNLAGAFRYMRDYPFTCWEQKLSKGVTASHYRNLKNYLPDDFEWPESAELVEEMLRQAADYQAPNGGMVYFVPEDEYVSPFLSAYTALAFNWLRDAGRTVPQPVEDKLHGYLRRLLRKDVFPDFYGKGMASTVRAVALAALSRRGGIGPPELHRYLPHAPYMSLFGKAHFLMAAQAVNGGGKIAREIRTMIDGHAQQSGGKFSFNEELDDGYARLLATPLRDNCAILSAAVKGDGGDADEMPFKLVRTVTQTRGSRDHWENTQENLFCLNALIDYSRRFESAKPAMKVAVDVERERIGAVEFRDLRDTPEVLVRPLRGGDAGSIRKVVLHRSGEGRLYHATRLSYAPLEEQSGEVDAGIDIRREYSVERQGKWVLLDGPDKFASRTVAVKRGELIRVDLFASLPTARNFVVVEDPVPGGLEPVNRDLATASAVDAEKGDMLMAGGSWWFRFADWISYNASRWSFYHREIKHDVVRFYSDYLPAGRYHLSYTAQAIAPGEFARRPARAEEMYDPDVYGRTASGKLIVETD
ncbi:MAG: alpha-2-macroglobulin family protein, partial [Gammaproteobacteria bacterium]